MMDITRSKSIRVSASSCTRKEICSHKIRNPPLKTIDNHRLNPSTMSFVAMKRKSHWNLIQRRTEDSMFVLGINYLKPEDIEILLKCENCKQPSNDKEAAVIAYCSFYAGLKPPAAVYLMLDEMPDPVLKYMYTNTPICEKKVDCINYAKKRDAEYDLDYNIAPKKVRGGMSHPYDFCHEKRLAREVGISAAGAVKDGPIKDVQTDEEIGDQGETMDELRYQRDVAMVDLDDIRAKYTELVRDLKSGVPTDFEDLEVPPLSPDQTKIRDTLDWNLDDVVKRLTDHSRII